MKISADIDFFLSFFDLIIFGLLIWAGYKGHKKGAIVEAIALLALLSGISISGLISNYVYQILEKNSDVPDLFSNLLLGGLLVLSIWFSVFISKKVQFVLVDKAPVTSLKLIGMGLGMVKYFTIIAIYCLVVFSVDCHSNFLPSREKRSSMAKLSRWTILHVFPNVRMEGDCVNMTDDIKKETKKQNAYSTKNDK